MLVTGLSFICSSRLSSYLSVKKNDKKSRNILAKRGDLNGNSSRQSQKQPNFSSISKTNLGRTAIAVLGLGFFDAGYSGDWSRIGVISKETEDLLKVAAFAVVPLCLFLVFSFRNESET